MNLSAAEVDEVPAVLVAVTSTVPADPAGAVATHVVVVEQLTAVAATPPKETVVVPGKKPDPVRVTTAPPLSDPAVGLMPVTSTGAPSGRAASPSMKPKSIFALCRP